MILEKNFLWGMAVGLVAGAAGYKLYSDHRQTIIASLENIKNRMNSTGAAAGSAPVLAAAGSAVLTDSLDLAELERQKEHLEDLIAEQQARAGQQPSAAVAESAAVPA